MTGSGRVSRFLAWLCVLWLPSCAIDPGEPDGGVTAPSAQPGDQQIPDAGDGDPSPTSSTDTTVNPTSTISNPIGTTVSPTGTTANPTGTTNPCSGEVCPGDVTFYAMGDPHAGGGDASMNDYQIAAMNAFPPMTWPSGMPSAGVVVGKPRAVLIVGDVTDWGFDGRNGTANQIAAFVNAYGLTGTDGKLRFPVFEGYGNHDYYAAEKIYAGSSNPTPVVGVVAGRNAKRAGIVRTSPEGGHYSWDWGGIHFVNVNMFPADSASQATTTSKVRDPHKSLTFLIDDLRASVGATCRPVVIMAHYGLVGFSADPDWWTDQQRTAFYDAVKSYNIIGYIHGHDHDSAHGTWKTFDTYKVGSPFYSDGGRGHFVVFRIHDNTLEAADVSWSPDINNLQTGFRGWQHTKTIRRTCQ